MYKKLIIYFFSGTGNAKAAAYWISENFTKNNIPSEVIKIDESTEVPISGYNSETLVGFCYPTHGFNAPPIVINFLRRFPKSPGTSCFLLNTRAGMKMYKIFTPGLSGVAQWVPAAILSIKGYRCIGYRPLDLPSNWIFLHPGIRKKVVNSIFDHCKKIVEKFSDKLMEGKKIYRGWLDFPLDLAISPIALAYYFFGRFALAKTFFASYKCNLCRKCIKNCPVSAIREINKRPFWTHTCESCMHCINNCPERAIETGHGFTFLLWWVALSIFPAWLIYLLSAYGIISSPWIEAHYSLIFYAILLLTGLFIIFSGYRILHQLLRIKWINYLMTWTSLTHSRFWRRYKAPDVEKKGRQIRKVKI